MDALAGSGLEPQLAIPVIVVVVGALLVYIFGFQKTEEPSFEHIALLQSSSSYKNRSVSTNNPKQTKSSSTSGATSFKKANGHVPSANSSNSNGSVKKMKPEGNAIVNKENKPPQRVQQKKENLKDPANKPEDFESGDWIPAVSRKDKVKKVKKDKKDDDIRPMETPGSPGKKFVKSETTSTSTLPPVLAAATSANTTPTKAPKIEDLLAEMKVLKEIESQKQIQAKNATATQTSPEKKVDPIPVPVAVAVSAKEKKVEPNEVKVEKAKKEDKEGTDFKTNIAFDEMGAATGDAWEEAKSRGAKKRTRTRKD